MTHVHTACTCTANVNSEFSRLFAQKASRSGSVKTLRLLALVLAAHPRRRLAAIVVVTVTHSSSHPLRTRANMTADIDYNLMISLLQLASCVHVTVCM